MRLAILSSHPIQYYAPLFRELAQRVDLDVFFAHKATAKDQAAAGFGAQFEWDVDLTSGYRHTFLENVSKTPGTSHFKGCDTPSIGRILRDGNYDALLSLGWHLKSFIQGLLHAKRLGVPVMVRGDSHLDTPRSALKTAIKSMTYPRFLRLFDAALYVGQRSQAYYQHYHYPDERLFFSPHCVDTAWFAARATQDAREKLRARFNISADTTVLLFAGKLIPFKRPGDVIAAAANCRGKGTPVEVMVAGSGELEQELRKSAETLRVPLHMLGFCNQTAMPEAYAAADILILPSTGRETWGLVANEAQACGKPIIVSEACGCAADLASDGVVGRTFPLADTDALARLIMDVINQAPSPETIASISRRYSLAAAADGICEALQAQK